ncbi:MAG TPA: hypothetical protein VER76_11650 [Pyrinomonadaceae bacterium]|nr:hypothetical protein [Pyrinomonadaceae bacterium]
MSSAAGKKMFGTEGCAPASTAGAFEKWQHFPASALYSHDAACCRVAREWVLATDFSQLGGESPLTGPRWIRQRYTWGPSRWPLSWCEAVERKTLDCGALASLAHELFRARGVKSYPAQFVQHYTDEATRHWREKWNREDCSVHWLNEDLIYHEGCAVAVRGDEIKLWDASAGWWVNPRQFGGYGGLVALRVHSPGAPPDTTFRWGANFIHANIWQDI